MVRALIFAGGTGRRMNSRSKPKQFIEIHGKPIIIYTILISFISPWTDYIFVSVIMGDNYNKYTVALGLYKMLEREFITTWYTRFAAGAVLVSIPIAILFVIMQRYYTEGISGAVKG